MDATGAIRMHRAIRSVVIQFQMLVTKAYLPMMVAHQSLISNMNNSNGARKCTVHTPRRLLKACFPQLYSWVGNGAKSFKRMSVLRKRIV